MQTNTKRDQHLLGLDFFNSKEYSTLEFNSTRLEKRKSIRLYYMFSVRLPNVFETKNVKIYCRNMILRNGKLEDLVELQKLFVDTVKTVCRNYYNDEQIKVWTSGIENADRWQKIFKTQY